MDNIDYDESMKGLSTALDASFLALKISKHSLNKATNPEALSHFSEEDRKIIEKARELNNIDYSNSGLILQRQKEIEDYITSNKQK